VAHFFVHQAEIIESIGVVRRMLDGLLSRGKRFIKLWDNFQPEIAFKRYASTNVGS